MASRRDRLEEDRRAGMERAARARVNANRVRAARATLRRELARGPSRMSCNRAAEVIAEPPEWAQTWPVGQLLSAVRGLGSVRLARGLQISGAEGGTALGALNDVQRDALVAWLRSGIQMARQPKHVRRR